MKKEIRLDEYGRLVFKHKTNPNLFAERPYYWVDRITVLDETEGRRVIQDTKYSTFDLTDWEPMTLDEYRSVKSKYKDFRKGKN